MERAYTVKEIDALREVCRTKLIWGYYTGPQEHHKTRVGDVVMWSAPGSYNDAELSTKVEEMVRTFMLAGLTADDLLAADAPPPPTEQMT